MTQTNTYVCSQCGARNADESGCCGSILIECLECGFQAESRRVFEKSERGIWNPE